MQRIRVMGLVFLVAVAGCSASHRAQPRNTQPSSTAPRPTSSSSAPTTAEARPEVRTFAATFGCGPADGPWIDVTVELTEPDLVYAQVSFDGRSYGRSRPFPARAGRPVDLGFDPALTVDVAGAPLRVSLFSASGTSVRRLAERTVAARPPGISCG